MPSPKGSQIPDIPSSFKLEGLITVTEEQLNRHIIEGHLPNPFALHEVGLQYDAELALHLGISLELTAGIMRSVLAAIEEGKFSSTPTYRKIKWLHSIGILELDSFEPKQALTQLNSIFSYRDHLQTELARLCILGLASGNEETSGTMPLRVDSFFEEFGLPNPLSTSAPQ
jgi:transcriptional regulator with XRE-family HTH domain